MLPTPRPPSTTTRWSRTPRRRPGTATASRSRTPSSGGHPVRNALATAFELPRRSVRVISIELRCSYDPATCGGNAPDGRKVQATLHWVAATDAVPAEVRLYNQLFARPDPNPANFVADLNPDFLEVLDGAAGSSRRWRGQSRRAVQFERQGYFCLDTGFEPGAARCSTVRLACATPGPRCRREGRLAPDPAPGAATARREWYRLLEFSRLPP